MFEVVVVVGSILVVLLIGVLVGVGLTLYVSRNPVNHDVHILEMSGSISNRLRTQLPPDDPAWKYERI